MYYGFLNKLTNQKLEWVQDYFLQLTAYAILTTMKYMAQTYVKDTFLCAVEQENIQQFDPWPHEFDEWKNEWWNRVYAYYEKHG